MSIKSDRWIRRMDRGGKYQGQKGVTLPKT